MPTRGNQGKASYTTTVPLVLGGLNAGGTNPQLVSDGLLVLDNGVFKREGLIEKRNGFISLESGLTDSLISSLDDRPVLVGESVKVFNGSTPTVGTFSAINTAQDKLAGLCDIQARSVIQMGAREGSTQTTEETLYPEVAYSGSVKAYCCVAKVPGAATFRVEARTYHRYSGTLLATHEGAATTHIHNAKLIVNSAGLFLITVNGSAQIAVYTINTTTGTFTLTETMSSWPTVGGSAAVKQIDACTVDGSNGYIAVVYTQATSDDVVIAMRRMAVGQLQDDYEIITAGGPNVVGVFKGDTQTAVVLWFDATSSTGRLFALGYVISGSTMSIAYSDDGVSAPIEIASPGATRQHISCTGVATTLGTTFQVYWSDRLVTGSFSATVHEKPRLFRATLTNTAGNLSVTTPQVMHLGLLLASRPMIDASSRRHLLCFASDMERITSTSGVTYQNDSGRLYNTRYVVIRDEGDGYQGDHRVVAQTLIGRANHGQNSSRPIENVATRRVHVVTTPVSIDTDIWIMGGGEILHEDGGFVDCGMVEIEVDTSPTPVPAVEMADGLTIPNGNPYFFDGKQLFELGWLNTPGGLRATQSSTGLAAGDWGFVAVYAYPDANGRVWVSQPSPVLTVTLASSSGIKVYIPACNQTRRDNVQIVLYMSESVNSTIYRRVAVLANDRDAHEVASSVLVAAPDATAEALYVVGGELQNEAPDAFRVHATYQGRHFYVRRDRPNELRYSKQLVDGIGIEHSGFLSRPVDPDGGDIVAIRQIDDKLIILKRWHIYATWGVGITSQGQGDGYQAPILVTNGFGCSNALSVVSTPLGLMFQSDDSIMLLDRSLQVKAIGRPVKYYLDSQTITSAVVQQKYSNVIFFCSSGYALVYNYLADQWNTYSNAECEFATISQSNRLYLKKSSGAVWAENRDNFSDPSSALITMTLQSGWYNLNTLLGYKRVVRAIILGYARGSNAQLNVKWGFNYDPNFTTAVAYDLDNLGVYFTWGDYFNTSGLSSSYEGKAMAISVRCPNPRCTAVRISIDDGSSAVDENVSIAAILLEVQIRNQEPHKVDAARSI